MTDALENLDFQINKSDFHDTRWQTSTLAAEPQAGTVVLRVDNFAFTANNITYAVFGDAMDYWQFYPAEEGWGRIPVWGFADVVASAHADIKIGERLFGYWPMSRYTVLTPAKTDAATITEGASQRQSLNPFYNRYQRCAADPGYAADKEDQQAIFRPLGLTAFLIDEWVADNEYWQAKRVILSSASSKTALCLAQLLHHRGGCEVTGLTSPANVEFVNNAGCYDRVLDYADMESLSADETAMFIDMAGNAEVRGRIHEHYGENLRQSITVGGTHWDALNPAQELPGPKPQFFFAPTHIGERLQAWGAGEFQRRFGQAWALLVARIQSGITMVHGEGKAAVEDVYHNMLDGGGAPDKGFILRL